MDPRSGCSVSVVPVPPQTKCVAVVTVPSCSVASDVFHHFGVHQIAAIVSGCTQHLCCLYPECRPGFRRTAPVGNVNIFKISTTLKAKAE